MSVAALLGRLEEGETVKFHQNGRRLKISLWDDMGRSMHLHLDTLSLRFARFEEFFEREFLELLSELRRQGEEAGDR